MLIEILLGGAALLLLIPVSVIFLQVLFAQFPLRHEIPLIPANIRIAVLVPAHNEAQGLAHGLRSIKPQLKKTDRLLVVADNCTDNTAKIALAHGAEAIERHDPLCSGKGYALDFGIRHLAQDPPDVVVIIDADCRMRENTLNGLARYAAHHNRPVQCLYLMFAALDAGLKSRIAEFAWLFKDYVRPLGNANLGLPCQLMGSGMAFPWKIISQAALANDNLVEDLKLAIDLCKAGTPPVFYTDASVTSYFPNTTSAQSAQRSRWEHGHLGMIISETPLLLWRGISGRNKNLLGMAFDLMVPPLALLVAMLAGIFTLAGFAYLAGASPYPLQIATAAALILSCAVLLAWRGWGRHIISLSEFLYIPVYVLAKIPHYFRFLFNRQKKWVRTGR